MVPVSPSLPGQQRVRHRTSGLCLRPFGGAVFEGNVLTLQPCDAAPVALQRFVYSGDPAGRLAGTLCAAIVPAGTPLCMMTPIARGGSSLLALEPEASAATHGLEPLWALHPGP